MGWSLVEICVFFPAPIKYQRPWITRVAKSHEFLKSTAEVLARLQQDATGFNRDMRCQSQKCFVLHVQEWSDSERPWILRCS